jgi:formate-dependent nitrite reductase membrane component NrfD
MVCCSKVTFCHSEKEEHSTVLRCFHLSFPKTIKVLGFFNLSLPKTIAVLLLRLLLLLLYLFLVLVLLKLKCSEISWLNKFVKKIALIGVEAACFLPTQAHTSTYTWKNTII